MDKNSYISDFELDDEFDPLADEEEKLRPENEIDDEDMSDIVDIPLIPNMPEGVVRKGVYDKDSYDDPREALLSLFEKNPGRRPIYLQIIEMCEGGKASSEIVKAVDALQADNYSVYAPITLCRTLEKAGALSVDEPQTAIVQEDDDAEYLEITEQVDPVWTSTELGLEVLRDEREGRAIKELLEHDRVYISIYERVLAFVDEAPRTKKEIDDIVDHDPLVQKPRRFSNHFIELLEKTDGLIWKNNTWNITELGKQTLEELKKGHEDE